jgi:hypothetical protein
MNVINRSIAAAGDGSRPLNENGLRFASSARCRLYAYLLKRHIINPLQLERPNRHGRHVERKSGLEGRVS